MIAFLIYVYLRFFSCRSVSCLAAVRLWLCRRAGFGSTGELVELIRRLADLAGGTEPVPRALWAAEPHCVMCRQVCPGTCWGFFKTTGGDEMEGLIGN